MYTPDHGDLFEWIESVGKWIGSVFIGVLGKISYELTMKRKLSLIEWIAVCGISVFIGYLSALWCVNNQMAEQGYFIVPIATLFGEKITMYLTDNFKSLANRIINGKNER